MPLEAQLMESRTTLSFVPAVGLLCFTIGVLLHHILIPRIQIGILVPTVIAVAGLGHLMFWMFPSYLSLLLGYGLFFGTAAGIGYGLALAMARQSSSEFRGWAVGLTVAAFAASGMLVSAMGRFFNIAGNVSESFGFIGLVFCVAALFLGLTLRQSKLVTTAARKSNNSVITIPLFPLLCLALGYFALCYPGLVFVSHGATILQDLGTSASVSALAPFILNTGYIIGAVLGGLLPSWLPGKNAPLVLILITTSGVGVMIAPVTTLFHILAILVIGIGFGSVVSVFFLLLSRKFDADNASKMFARLNVSYGLAGLLAPAITGKLYDLNASYDIALWFAMAVGVFGIAGVSSQVAVRSIT